MKIRGEKSLTVANTGDWFFCEQQPGDGIFPLTEVPEVIRVAIFYLLVSSASTNMSASTNIAQKNKILCASRLCASVLSLNIISTKNRVMRFKITRFINLYV